jgi:hypothetical protein
MHEYQPTIMTLMMFLPQPPTTAALHLWYTSEYTAEYRIIKEWGNAFLIY